MLIFTKSRVAIKNCHKKGMGNNVLSIKMNVCYFNTGLRI